MKRQFNYKNLYVLTVMQLASSYNFSFFKNVKKTLLITALSIAKFIGATLLFYVIFAICSLLKIFGQSVLIPDTFLSLIFTIFFLLSTSYTLVRLTNALYKSQDGKFLLTLPVKYSEVFYSKIITFFIYDLIKNARFTLPLFIAYGVFNNAVWYYYLWLLVCYITISLVPVSISAVFSVVWFYLSNYISKNKVLQATLIVLTGLTITQILFKIVSFIPENINILAQWNNITQNVITPFLNKFANAFSPFYRLTLMIIGSSLSISLYIFSKATAIYFCSTLLLIITSFIICNIFIKPLFLKMASKQMEYETSILKVKPNITHKKYLSPFIEELTQNFRSSKYIAYVMLQILLPPMLIFLLNKLYLSMQTSFNGLFMTKAFNMLVLLISSLSFNNEYATIYSKQGNIRNFNKTRPISEFILCFSKIAPRLIIGIISVFLGAYFYYFTTKVSLVEFICFFITCSLICSAHLLWCAELDVMNPLVDKYLSMQKTEDNPNENNATIYSLITSVVFAFLLYFLAKTSAITVFYKLLALSIAFFSLRFILFYKRVKLYYKEK